MRKMSKEELAGLVKAAYEDIVCFSMWPLGYELSPSQVEMAELSQRYKVDPSYNRLLLLEPTGLGKTTIFSQILPLYEIYKNRDYRIALISNTVTQAEAMMRTVVDQIENNETLKMLFGNLKPTVPQKWTNTEVVVARTERGRKLKDPSLHALGVGTALKSRHYDLMIFDDILDRDNTFTAEQRGRVSKWFFEDAMSRLDAGGRAIVVGTVEHYDDLYHELMKNSQWQAVVKDAIIDEEKKIVLDPVRLPWDRLMQIKEESGIIAFNKRWRNIVLPDTVKSFPAPFVHACRDDSIPLFGGRAQLPEALKNLKVYQGVDLAISQHDTAAYFVILTYGYDPATKKRYVLDILRERLRSSEQKRAVMRAYDDWRPIEIAIENNAYQDFFRQEMRDMGLPVVPLFTGSKKADLEDGVPSLSVIVESKNLVIPHNFNDRRTAQLVPAFETELVEYPVGRTGDMLMAWYFAEQRVRLMQQEPRQAVVRHFTRGRRRWQVAI